MRDLLLRKGGLSVCILRPPTSVQLLGSGQVDVLSLFEPADVRTLGLVKEKLRMGTTTKWSVVKGAKGATSGFLRALAGRLRADAFLEADEATLHGFPATVVAANSAGWPVSLELMMGLGGFASCRCRWMFLRASLGRRSREW